MWKKLKSGRISSPTFVCRTCWSKSLWRSVLLTCTLQSITSIPFIALTLVTTKSVCTIGFYSTLVWLRRTFINILVEKKKRKHVLIHTSQCVKVIVELNAQFSMACRVGSRPRRTLRLQPSSLRTKSSRWASRCSLVQSAAAAVMQHLDRQFASEHADLSLAFSRCSWPSPRAFARADYANQDWFPCIARRHRSIEC